MDEDDEDFELYDEYAEHSGIRMRGILSQRPRPPKEAILSLGFYITRFMMVFKVCTLLYMEFPVTICHFPIFVYQC